MGPTAAGRRRHLLIPTSIVLALLATACSGGDDAAPTTTVAVTAAPTTTPPTTEPPTTTAAPTTVAPTTAPPTTAPPTTVVPGSVPLGDLEAALPLAVGGFVDAVNAAFRDPANETLRAGIAELATSAMVEQLTQALDQYVVDGRFFRESASSPSSIQPFVETISTAGGSSAAMDACVIDTDVLVERAADGTETVVDDSVDANVILYSFEFVDGRWLVSGLDVADAPVSGDCT